VTATGIQRAIGYFRVSTQEQAERGLGLPVQEQAIVDFGSLMPRTMRAGPSPTATGS
jgi:hypothetical protein